MAISESLRAQLSDLVHSEPVVLFMKGTRRAPQCGFSAQVVQILDSLLPSYQTVDVLSSPELRDGIKAFSDWPTIPQLYVGAKFIGGSDIVRELHEQGELEPLVKGVAAAPPPPPAITITGSARAAFDEAAASMGGDVLHLAIDAKFQNDLFFGPPEPGELELDVNGLKLRLDAATARRAAGLAIDFVPGAGGGFKLENPNQPKGVKALDAPALKALLDRGGIRLFDVRPEAERRLASIPGARALDDGGQAELLALDRGAAVALHCHHGVRSRSAAEQLVSQGFTNVYNLEGGIDAWSELVDPATPRY